MKKKTTIPIKIKEGTRRRGQILVGTEKAHPTGELVIVAKFGGHVLHHVASRLTNVIRQGGREAD